MNMLRITQTLEDGNIIRLRMDGTVNADSFADVRAICSSHNDGGDNLILLDMAGVDFMTEDVARKLEVLRSERVQIINCSPFVETLLKVFSDISRNGTP
jgi:anti-anti-sigma regulatory factor